MGAALGILQIKYCNLTAMEILWEMTSVDLSEFNDFEDMVNAKLPLSKVREMVPKWRETDTIVVIAEVPMVDIAGFQVQRSGSKRRKPVDVKNVNRLPNHCLYGGTSAGYGTDPNKERQIINKPGSFLFDGKHYGFKAFRYLDEGQALSYNDFVERERERCEQAGRE